MPKLRLATQELAKLLSTLSHPKRIRIVEELRQGERDVSELTKILDISQTSVSQHLASLRRMRLLKPRRAGQHVFYTLAQPELAGWLVEGLKFVEGEFDDANQIKSALKRARLEWQVQGG